MNGHAPRLRARLARLARFDFSLMLVGAALAVASLFAPARAQDLDDASFSGVVLDQHGAVVVGATVTATLASTGAARAAVTDGAGRYRFVELPPGVYALRAERAGFATEERRELSVAAGQSLRLDFTLRPAGVAAEQTVVSGRDAPHVDTTRVVAGGSVTREELERLPAPSRSPLDYVFLLGGVTEEPLAVLY